MKALAEVLKKGGLAALSDEESRATAELLIRTLTAFGLFLVPVGELEGWLRALGVDAGKSSWLGAMLTRMGSDPQAADYVRPGTGDVWEFVEQIVRWIRDPNRQGMEQQ